MYKVDSNGDVHLYQEFTNAFRGVWLVWSEMCERYTDKKVAVLMMEQYKWREPGEEIKGGMQQVWDLWKDESIPESHRIVMGSTFDNVMVRRENFGRLVAAIEEYAKEFNPGTLVEQARAIEKMGAEEDTLAVCWNATSVNASPWQVCEENPEDEDWPEYRPYNILTEDKHWFLFERLDEFDE
jgi:hypothetical protein